MTSVRLQLHSNLGRQLLLAQSYMPWVAILGCLASVVVAVALNGLRPAQLFMLVFAYPALLFSRWARRNSTPVFATPEGLELSTQQRTIPWAAVATVWRMPFSSLIAIYRVTFSDGTAALTFYCCEDLESVVRRFKATAHETPQKSDRPAA